MSKEGGKILKVIYDIMDGGQKEDESSKQQIEAYLNQFSHAFTPGRGARKLGEWKSSHQEQYDLLDSSTQKNVRNWIRINKDNPSKTIIPERNTLLKVCIQSDFADGDIREINDLLYSFNYDGLHVRSPQDAVYYFALKNKLSWEEVSKAKAKFEGKSRSLSEKRRSSTGRCTNEVREEIDTFSSLDELVEYIQGHPEDFGPIKISAYKTAVQRYKEYLKEGEDDDCKNLTKEQEDSEVQLLDPDRYDSDAWTCPSCERNRNIAKWFCQSARMYNKNDEKSILFNMKSIRNRSIPISRGEFMILELFLMFQDWPSSLRDADKAKKKIYWDLNERLYECGYDQLNEERGVFDKIILDCIDASVQVEDFWHYEYVFIDILNALFDYLQEHS